jgi:tetratricopeptide (TPR) repeat protein
MRTSQELAEAAYAAGDLASAERIVKEILAASPLDIPATILRGLICARTGKAAIGAVYLQNVLRQDPDRIEAHMALSTILNVQGKAEEAIHHAVRAVEVAPDDAEAFNHLGLILVGNHAFPDAVEAFSRAVNLAPQSASFTRNLASALGDSGRERDAMIAWKRVTDLTPTDADAWVALGRLQMMMGLFEPALESGTAAINADRANANAHLLVALSLSELTRGDEAETHLRRAIELAPEDGLAYAALGFWSQEQGRFEDARPLLEKSIELRPLHGFAFYNLVRQTKIQPDDPLLDRIRDTIAHPEIALRDRGYLHYALGKAYEDLERYGDAIAQFDSANACAYETWLARRPWSPEAYTEDFTRRMELFPRERIQELQARGLEDETPLLIVGMIRSGTSLVEQIVSSHPDIVGGGEQEFWHRREPDTYAADGLTIDPDRLRAVAQDYLAMLQRLGNGARRVTDKLPHNYALLGHIVSAFPNARVVHLTRNPVDNALSVYTTAYQKPPSFAHRRDHIVHAYREYQRIVSHWRNVLPADRFLDVSYEELVADREAVTRRLIEFVGLPWSDACLSHESNRRAVRTPSLWQVRQPVYGTSVERWRRFEPWISEFAALRNGNNS